MRGAVAVGILACACGALSHADIHLVEPGTSATEPVAPETMNQRVKDAAREYRKHAPVPRIGFYDVAIPATPEEYSALDGHALLLVVALSQEAEELPPTRVYASGPRDEVPLKLLSSTLSKVPADSLPGKVLGENRWDGLYLIPAYVIRDKYTLSLDFASHRKGFVLTTFSASDADGLKSMPVTKPTSSGPSPEALMAMILREYPGFARK